MLRYEEEREIAKADGLPQGRPEGDINVEPEGIHDRQVRLTPFSTELHDGILSDDGRTLYYIFGVRVAAVDYLQGNPFAVGAPAVMEAAVAVQIGGAVGDVPEDVRQK